VGGKLLFEIKLRPLAATHFARRFARLSAAPFAVAACLFASPAAAQVMDISSDGTVAVRQGSGAATWQVVSPAPDSSDDRGAAPDLPPAAVTTANGALVPQQYAAAVDYAAASANISPSLLAALVWQESRWNAQALSPKGAIGLAQLMPGTARDLGVDPSDPVANLVGGARYLRQQLDQFGGDVEKALAAYNAGPGRVRSAGGVPAIAETRTYVASIVHRISTISAGGTQ
jgi:soluble lytic murein transglycosylase-like protein